MSDFIVRETAGERIQVLPRPIVLPGKCAVCGHTGTNGTGDQREVLFLDIGLDVDFYGRVYLCTTCVVQMVNTIGFLSPTQAEDLRTRITTQESELIVLREQNERLRGSLSSLLGVTNDSVSSDILLSEYERGAGREKTPDGDSTPTDVEFAFDESVSEQGTSGISSPHGIEPGQPFQL